MLRRGYTLVELTVIIVVIGILATLTIFSYNYLIQQSIEASMKSDLEAARNSVAAMKAGKKNYPADASAANNGQGLKASAGNQLTYASTGAGYIVSVTNPKSAKGFCLNTGVINPCSLNWSAISAGMGSSCGIVDGKAYCWGSNWVGQLGNGSTDDVTYPVAVSTAGVLANKTITDIASGDEHVCVVADGAPYCWGYNGGGQLGNGTTADSYVPVAVDMTGVLAGKTVTRVAAGGNQSCAIADGKAYCWGDTFNGALGNGVSAATDQTTPIAVNDAGVLAGKTVTHITLGQYYSYNGCVIADGKAYCWGDNGWGQTGNGVNTAVLTPIAVDDSGVLAGKTVTDISMYEYHTCAVASGAAYCWGGNGDGYLGNGESNGVAIYPPVAVDTSGLLAGKTVTAIAPGDYTTCAIADGLPYCWGNGGSGQRGDNAPQGAADALTPVAVVTSGVLAGKTATAIASGYSHTCVLADNRPFCWGDTWAGELGNGSDARSNVPVMTLPAI